MFNIDTFRLIKNTFKRFLALTLIVFIGVAFMMGLMSSKTIMKDSLDVMNDEYHLHDLQLYSQYGFNHQDIFYLKSTEGVEDIYASKQLDVQAKTWEGFEGVVRVSELNRRVNQLKLVEGRMPKAKNECVVLNNPNLNYSIQIGQHLMLSLDDSDINESLRYRDFLVVGKVSCPEYITKTGEVSNLKNKDLTSVVFIDNSNFVGEYFTTVYLTLKGACDYTSYTPKYEEYIDVAKRNVESTAFLHQDDNKNLIKTKAQAQLDDARAEFIEKKQDGAEQLEKAKQQLDDAHIQILNIQSQIEMLETMIDYLKATYQDKVDDGEIIDIDISKISSYMDSEVVEYAKDKVEELESQYNQLKGYLRTANYQYEKGMQEYKEAVFTYNDEIAKAEAKIKQAQQDLDDLPNAKWIVLDRNSHYSSYMFLNSADQMGAIGYSFPFIFFLVAALVCLTTMKRLIDEQRGQIGVFVALGYSNIAIMGKYVIYALMATLLGGIPGIFFGQALFPTVIYYCWGLMYMMPAMKFEYPLWIICVSLFSFAILMAAVSAFVVYKTVNEIPASLLRPKAPKNAKEILLEKFKFLWNRLSFTSKVTARNLFRYKSRFFMTVIGIAGCTGLLIVGFGLKDSISSIVSTQYGQIFNYDYEISLANNHHVEENIELLKSDFDNVSVVEMMQYTSSVSTFDKNNSFNCIVLDPRDSSLIYKLHKTDKKTPLQLDNNGVIISQKFASGHNIKKGDTLNIESRNGLKGDVVVSDICEMYFQHYMFISSAYYQKVFDEPINNTTIAVSSDDQEGLFAICNELQDFDSIKNFDSMISNFNTMISTLNLIVAVIIITSGSLSFVVLVNLTQVNISERQREIATLKVLGFNSHEVMMYVFKEIFILTIIGALVGVPLGIFEHHFIMNVIQMDMIMFGMKISLFSFSISVAITLVFSLIVSFSMRKQLDRVDMIESLKSVE